MVEKKKAKTNRSSKSTVMAHPLQNKKRRLKKSVDKVGKMSPNSSQISLDLSDLFLKIMKDADYEFRKVLATIAQHFGAFGAVLWKAHKQNDKMVLSVISQYFKNENVTSFCNLPVSDCLTGLTHESGEAQFNESVLKEIEKIYPDQSGNVSTCKAWFEFNGISTMAATPVVYEDHSGGVLSIYWKTSFSQTEETMAHLQKISHALPFFYHVALDRAGLSLANDIFNILPSKGSSEKGLSQEQVFEKLGRLVEENLKPLVSSIYLCDPQNPSIARLHFTTQKGAGPRKIISYGEEKGFISWVLRNNKTLIIGDILDWSERAQKGDREYSGLKRDSRDELDQEIKTSEFEKPQKWSMIVVPILNGDQCLGAISCFAKKCQPFFYLGRDEVLLKIIANHLSDYWANHLRKKHREREARSARLLFEAFENLNRLTQQQLANVKPNIELILKEALKAAEDLIHGAEILDVRLLDESGKRLYFAATRGKQWNEGNPEMASRRKNTRFTINKRRPKSAGARVFVEGKTILETTEHRQFKIFPETTSIISAPINDGVNIRGVLDIRNILSDCFTVHDQRMAEILGQLLGLSLSAVLATNSLRKEKAEINQFYQDFTHQVRSPIFQLRLRVSDLLKGKVKDTKKEWKLIASLTRKGERVVNSYKLFLDLSKGESPKTNKKAIGTFALKKALKELGDDYGLMLRPSSNIKLIVNLDSFDKADTYNLCVDWDLLEHALGNILDNAVKYSYPNTEISVRGEWTSNYLSILTTNSGMRLSKGEIPYVTTRGWRGSESDFFRREGMGIGLWIVENIMKAHDGRLVVQPTSGSGNTTVKLILPATPAGRGKK